MFHHWLRLLGWLLIAAVFAMISMILLGRIIPTDTVIEYRVHDGATFSMLIRVSDRAFNVILAGTRCFRSLPVELEWKAIRHQNQPTYYTETVKAHDARSIDAINRIRCVHVQRLHIRATAHALNLLP